MIDVPAMARYLGVSEYTVRQYAKNKVIPAHKLGDGLRALWRFDLSEVRAHLAAPPADPWVNSKKPRGRRSPS